jgi:hypothetical protein
LLQEERVIYAIKCLGDVDCNQGCTPSRLGIIETYRNPGWDRQESCCAGVFRGKTMLNTALRKSSSDVRHEEAFWSLGIRAKEPDGPIRSTFAGRLSRLQDRNDNGCLSNRWKVSQGDRQVEEMGQEPDAFGTQVF